MDKLKAIMGETLTVSSLQATRYPPSSLRGESNSNNIILNPKLALRPYQSDR